jgi:hypothetical protein
MKSKIFLVVLCLLIVLPQAVVSANYSVAPLIVDIEAKPHDTFTRTITLNNYFDRPVRLYASVNEIVLGDTNEIKSFVPASMSNRTTAVTSWLEITRGRIDLAAGEAKEVPLTIRVNQNTPPGTYHAFVGFAAGSNRDIAEAKVLEGQGMGTVVRIVVGTKQQEFLRLVSFTTDRFSFSPDAGKIKYTLQNTGDVPLSPSGDVIIYDSRGRELTTVSLEGASGASIAPGEQVTYEKELPFLNRLGKNKAYLSLEYGVQNRAALYDTNFYYSIPWFYLVIIMLLLALVLTILVILLRRNMMRSSYAEDPEAQDVPMFVGKKREHNEYEHDINLKNSKE